MEAVNLTIRPVELAHINGAGLLGPAGGADESTARRTLVEVMDHERSLQAAGIIALLDSAGRRRPASGGDDE